MASLAWPSGGILVKRERLQGFIEDSNRWMVFSSLSSGKGFQDGKGNSVPGGPRHPCNPNPDENSRLQFYSLELFLGYFQANEARLKVFVE